MKKSRLRILIMAHELSPIQGSECAVGWNIVTRLSKYHDVTVIYANGTQFGKNSYVDAVRSYIQSNGPIQGLRFVNIENPKATSIIASINSLFRRLSPVGLPLLYYLGYKYWQENAYKEAEKLQKVNRYQIIHQLTQVTFREPGYCWKLGIPFFWGPTGKTSILPVKFYPLLSFKGMIIELIRSFSNFYQFNFSSRIRKANKIASVIYAFSEQDIVKFNKRATGKVKVMLDAGTYEGINTIHKNTDGPRRIKCIWCGRLNDLKAPSILLKAIALVTNTNDLIDLLIIGSGPLEESMHKLAKDLHLNNIEWIERVSHEEVFRLMGEADFLIHTSLSEATTTVIPEALSMGLPVICHDISGMSIAVNETCGIKIPFISPKVSIQGFHNAINKLILDNNYLEELKTGARNRSREISWDIMAETIANDYSEAEKHL